MQFVTSGNRIAVENFTVGYLYTITFTGGEYIHCACTGIGMDFVMFSRTAPEYTFALTMETAEGVSSIDLYSEGGGTMNYNDLTNKPQINGVELTGNKTSSDIGIQPLITADNKLSYTLVSGLGTAATTASSDYATAAQGALADSAVQPADMNSALNTKQNLINSDNMLSADLVDDTSTTNKFATAAELAQIETNKNNILYIANNNVINILNRQAGTYTSNGVTFATNIDGSISLSGTATNSAGILVLSSSLDTTDDTYILYGDGFIEGVYMDTYETDWANQRTFTSWVETNPNTKIWRLIVSNGTNVNNVTIYPMMCKKSLFDGLYHQPAMSNAELTAAIHAIQAQLANQ